MNSNISIPGYKINIKIGEGFCAEVYRAQDLETQKDVAIKVFKVKHPRVEALFQRFGGWKKFIERENLVPFSKADINPNLVPSQIIDADMSYYLLMPLYDTDLNKLSQSSSLGGVFAENFDSFLFQLFSGLNQLQSLDGVGYSHFDLKSDCVMLNLSEGGLECAIGDFGTCSPISDKETRVGDLKRHSPLYLRETQIGTSTDVHLIGKLLLEALTGTYPGKNMVAHLSSGRPEHKQRIVDIVSNFYQDDLSPTKKYTQMVEDNLLQLPKYAKHIKDLISAMIYEEIKSGEELVSEFNKIKR